MRVIRKTLCLAYFLLVLSVPSAFTQEAKDFDMNSENKSSDYAECAAYYRLVYFAMNASNEKEIANAYRELEDTAMLYSLLFANKGRDKDMAIKVTNSRIELNLKKMKQEVDNRNENISILTNKYHLPCQERIESLNKLSK